MIEENFSQEDISEDVNITGLPVFTAGRLSCGSLTSKHPLREKIDYQNMNIQKLLSCMDGGKIKSNSNSQSKSKSRSKTYHTQNIPGKHFQKGADKRQLKLIQLRQQKLKKQLEGCTFQPNTHIRSQKPIKRSLSQFLIEQQNFVKKANNKKQILKQEVEQKSRCQFKPQINTINYTRQKPIYERLYELRQKSESNVLPNKEQKFRPSIGNKSKKIVRNQEIGVHLYQDALRRQSKKSQPNICVSTNPKNQQKSINLNNQKYVAQRFIKELYHVLGQMDIDITSPLQYLTFNQLLYRLGFVTYLEQVDNKLAKIERSLVYQAYSLLLQTNPTIKNICLFLLALIGVYHIDPINFSEGESEQHEMSLNQKEGRKLQKHFDLLYRNRLLAENSKRSSKTQQSIVYTFKPEINPQSLIMAGNFRNKLLKQTASINGQIDLESGDNIKHVDLLILNKINKQKIRQQIRIQQEEKELKECTFKPSIIEKRNGTNNTSDQGSSKSLELYNLHKKRLSKNEIMDSQKQQKEELKRKEKGNNCTFVPTIHNKPRKSLTTNVPINTDKQVLRMLQSRKQKDQINKFLSRGYDKTSLNKKQPKEVRFKQPLHKEEDVKKQPRIQRDEEQSQNLEETPFLVIDVNLGTHVDHITVFRHDIERAETLAEQFSKKHNLDQETKDRLIDLLYQQINNVIERIEEQDEHEIN